MDSQICIYLSSCAPETVNPVSCSPSLNDCVVLLLQDERENGEQALSGIRKTHEKMKNELRGRITVKEKGEGV